MLAGQLNVVAVTREIIGSSGTNNFILKALQTKSVNLEGKNVRRGQFSVSHYQVLRKGKMETKYELRMSYQRNQILFRAPWRSWLTEWLGD